MVEVLSCYVWFLVWLHLSFRCHTSAHAGCCVAGSDRGRVHNTKKGSQDRLYRCYEGDETCDFNLCLPCAQGQAAPNLSNYGRSRESDSASDSDSDDDVELPPPPPVPGAPVAAPAAAQPDPVAAARAALAAQQREFQAQQERQLREQQEHPQHLHQGPGHNSSEEPGSGSADPFHPLPATIVPAMDPSYDAAPHVYSEPAALYQPVNHNSSYQF